MQLGEHVLQVEHNRARAYMTKAPSALQARAGREKRRSADHRRATAAIKLDTLRGDIAVKLENRGKPAAGDKPAGA